MSRWLSYNWNLDGWVTFETDIDISSDSRYFIEKMIVSLRKLGLA